MREDEDRALRPLQELPVGPGVAPRSVGEGFAAWERIAARMGTLPGPVLLEAGALEVAHVDVVEKGFRLEGDVSALEGDRGRRPRPVEARVDANLDRDGRQLLTEQPCLLTPLPRQSHLNGGGPPGSAFRVERRLAVAGDHVQLHGRRLAGLPAPNGVCAQPWDRLV